MIRSQSSLFERNKPDKKKRLTTSFSDIEIKFPPPKTCFPKDNKNLPQINVKEPFRADRETGALKKIKDQLKHLDSIKFPSIKLNFSKNNYLEEKSNQKEKTEKKNDKSIKKDLGRINRIRISEKLFIDAESQEKDFLSRYQEKLKFKDDIPNFTEKFKKDDPENEEIQRMQSKCNCLEEKSNPNVIKIKIIIVNDKKTERLKNYIKNNPKFKKYENNKHLVDKLVLSRNDINKKEYLNLTHNLDNYNIYAEVINTLNCKIYEENEINKIRSQFEKINKNIDKEINAFIELCVKLIIEYLKFVLIKETKFNQCEKCGTKIIYISFKKDQQKHVQERKPSKKEIEAGINIVRNFFFPLLNLYLNEAASDINNLVKNVIYMKEEVDKNELKVIEKNSSGTVLFIKNIKELKLLLDEIDQKNKKSEVKYKFLLICSGNINGDIAEFLSKTKQEIIDDVVLLCSDKQKYEDIRKNNPFIYDIIDNTESLEEYIKNCKRNSKLYETFRIIDYTSYTNIHNKIHKKIAKYYGKKNYKFEDAIQILKDFLENEYKGDLKIEPKELTKEEKEKALLNSL